MEVGFNVRKALLSLLLMALIACLTVSALLIKFSSLHTSQALSETVSHEIHLLNILTKNNICPQRLPPDIQQLLIMEGQHIICIRGQNISPKYLMAHQGITIQQGTITISIKDNGKIAALSFDYSLTDRCRFHKIYISTHPNLIFSILGASATLLNTKFFILSIPFGGISVAIILAIGLIALTGYTLNTSMDKLRTELEESVRIPIKTAVTRLCNTACRNTPLNPKIPEDIRVLITIASAGEIRLAKILKLMTSAKHQRLEDFFKTHISTIVDILNADGGSVMMKKGNRYEIISYTGLPGENIAYISSLLKNGDKLWSIKVLEDSGDIKYIQRTTDNPLFIHPESGFKTVTWLGIPITINGETVAVINIDYTSEVKIGNADILAAKLVKAFIENSASFHRELNNALMSLHRDYLTGLPDRKMAETIMRRLQMEGKRFGIIFLDLDNFSSINDTLGHTAGDNILRKIVQAIKTSIRSEDTATRYGGDEFLIIINASNRETVEKIANRILEHIRKAHPDITGSIGMVLVSPDMSLAEAIEKADRAMYRAKDKGGNTAEWGG